MDRSAAYYARYAAKNIVAAELADKCEIQIAYAIGIAEPLSINVNTLGTGKIDDDRIARILTDGGIFDFRPATMIRVLGVTAPPGAGATARAATTDTSDARDSPGRRRIAWMPYGRQPD